MPIDHFDEPTAATYDADHAERFDSNVIEPTVDALAGLANGGPALEFAVGTGRLALPLAARGIGVDGIDLSSAMLDRLRAKPGSESVDVVAGDITSVDMGRSYRLVYLVFNTIGNLMTQENQVACFRNAARHLEVGGHFVIENTVPDLRRLTPGSDSVAFDSSAIHVGVDHFTDLVAQQAVSRHFHFENDPDSDDGPPTRRRVRYDETPWRFTWPSELDLMGQLAGLELVERWADWDRSVFTGESTSHVSVWRRGEP